MFNRQIASHRHPLINELSAVRFVRSQDPVVTVPAESLGYKHVNNLITLDEGNSHAMTGYRTLIETNIGNISHASSSIFPSLSPNFYTAFSDQPIFLNGMKVIFDQPVGVYPVNLESKEEARRNGT